MKKAAIIDLDSGNLISLKNAILANGFDVQIIQKPAQDVDVLFLPGQGRFAHIAKGLDNNLWRSFLQEWNDNARRLIGICVGMQILFEASEEDPGAQGLGFLKGTVTKLTHPKTPMIGWACLNSDNALWNQQYAYFVNSFAVSGSENCTAETLYGNSFCASVQKGNLYGFQYHPEKSGSFGREVIAQCLQ